VLSLYKRSQRDLSWYPFTDTERTRRGDKQAAAKVCSLGHAPIWYVLPKPPARCGCCLR
jgi:hypothetical protein